MELAPLDGNAMAKLRELMDELLERGPDFTGLFGPRSVAT
jgi:hypothetical protein